VIMCSFSAQDITSYSSSFFCWISSITSLRTLWDQIDNDHHYLSAW
jgi:hypothetical protein